MESITGSVGGTSRVLVALDLLRDEVVRLGDAGLVVTQCRPWVSPTTGRVGWDVVVRAAGADQYEALGLAVRLGGATVGEVDDYLGRLPVGGGLR